jgi:hypothetical protein
MFGVKATLVVDIRNPQICGKSAVVSDARRVDSIVRKRAKIVSQATLVPITAEPWQSPLPSEKFLNGALFEVALLGEELLEGFDEAIRIAQRLDDSYLLDFAYWDRDPVAGEIVAIERRN